MTIKGGDKGPSVKLWQVTPEGVKDITTDDLFRGKRVALFAVPGAYTRTCSQRHLPSYVTNAAALKGKGIDTVACIADRKSTRLNSSHQIISYAAFCLKKK